MLPIGSINSLGFIWKSNLAKLDCQSESYGMQFCIILIILQSKKVILLATTFEMIVDYKINIINVILGP